MTSEIASGAPLVVTEQMNGAELFPQPGVVAVRVDGVIKDLHSLLEPGQSAEPVMIDSPDGLEILRHSAAHVLAQAVQTLNPEAKLGIGPPVVDGFYDYFDCA